MCMYASGMGEGGGGGGGEGTGISMIFHNIPLK